MTQDELRARLDRSRAEVEALAATGDESAQRLLTRFQEIDRIHDEGVAAINSAYEAGLRRLDREYYALLALSWACLAVFGVACEFFIRWLSGAR